MGNKITWRLLWGASLGLLIGCGTEPRGDDPPILPEDSLCLSCTAHLDQDGPTDYDPAPRINVTPQELMFYPDTIDSPELEPKEVVVTNLTGHLVLVLQAYITSSGAVLGGGGTEYFAVEPLTEPVYLDDNESFSLWVTFLGSAYQRSAQLVVNTTDPTDHTLLVELTGKYFLDG